MTTEYRTPTDYRSAPGYDDAVEAAQRAGDGGPIDGFVERMAERIGGKASVRAVFGDPIERDGITVIPVAKVRWGFGGGAGRGPVAVGPGIAGEDAPQTSLAESDASQSGSGSGGGGAASAEPIGYLEIGPEGATFRQITPAMPSPAFLLAAGLSATMVFRGLARLIRR
jgi:uncharacterized spore protein YtfJ